MVRVQENPVAAFLGRQSPMILDGGLATELEARGCDIGDELWSAGYLLMDQDAIRDLHLEYLRSGADCVIAATYQATLQGFKRRGLAPEDSRALLGRAVELAREARDLFLAQAPSGRRRPLVAASVGPYGAFLADGSEFTGDYDRDEDALYAFHRERFQILAEAGADVLACETIPSRPEARALARLLDETPGAWAWMSFSCRDERRLCDGSPLAEVVAEVQDNARIVAVGVNCVAPRNVSALIEEVRRASGKPVVAYPNSGEIYDAAGRRWSGDPDPRGFAARAAEWVDGGASLVGGCCRTGPEHIRRIRRRLIG